MKWMKLASLNLSVLFSVVNTCASQTYTWP